MISIDSEFINPRPQHHFEANEMNYIGGKYVYTYNTDWQDHSDWELSDEIPTTCCMAYMTSTTPLDSHKYRGKWYVIYHTEMLQDDMQMADGGFRSLMVDEINVDEEKVHISPTDVTKKGVNQIQSLNPYIKQEAETAAATEGIKFEQGDKAGNMYVCRGKAFAKHGLPDESIILLRKVDFGKGSKKVRLGRMHG